MFINTDKLMLIARQGADAFILVPVDDNNPLTHSAQILDVAQGRLFPPMSLQSILAQGYWTEYRGTDEELRVLAEKMQA